MRTALILGLVLWTAPAFAQPTADEAHRAAQDHLDRAAAELQAARDLLAALPPPADTEPPSAPSALTVSVTGSTVDLTWAAATDNRGVTGYFVERCQGDDCTAFNGIGQTEMLAFVDAGLMAGFSYRYQVRAFDAAGLQGESSPASVAVIDYVLPATNAQAVLDGVVAGTTVSLDPALTYPALTLRTSGITLKTLHHTPAPLFAVALSQPTDVAPTLAGLARVPSLIIAAGTSDIRVQGVEVFGNGNDLIWCAKGAQRIAFENVWVHGNGDTKNGITLNCTDAIVRRSVIDDIYRFGQESHGVIGYDGPGPYVIEDSFIRAASIGIMFGGADPTTPQLVPSNIQIRNNVITKKLEWRGVRNSANLSYAVKNLVELKNAQDVVIADNLMRYSWVDGQTAFGLVLSIRNQSGNCTWCVIQRVQVLRNRITDVGTAVSILARDYTHPSGVMNNVLFQDNTFEIKQSTYGGRGATFEISRGPVDLVIEGTRVENTTWVHSFLFFDVIEYPLVRLIVRNNPRVLEGEYGMWFAGLGATGRTGLASYAPEYVWENNGVVDFPQRSIQWPAGTTYVP